MTRRPVRQTNRTAEAIGEFLGSMIYAAGAVAFISWPVMVALGQMNHHVGFWVLWFIGSFIVGMVRVATSLDD